MSQKLASNNCNISNICNIYNFCCADFAAFTEFAAYCASRGFGLCILADDWRLIADDFFGNLGGGHPIANCSDHSRAIRRNDTKTASGSAKFDEIAISFANNFTLAR